MNAVKAQTFLHRLQQFANAEQADDGNQEADPFDQFGESKGQPHIARNAIHADGGEGKT